MDQKMEALASPTAWYLQVRSDKNIFVVDGVHSAHVNDGALVMVGASGVVGVVPLADLVVAGPWGSIRRAP